MAAFDGGEAVTRFFKRLAGGENPGQDRSDDGAHRLDLLTLAQLEKQGANLTQPRLLEHFLYEPSEEAARAVAAQLVNLGYKADVDLSPDGSGLWSIMATHTIVVSPSEIRRIRAELTSLATAAGGEYDGWGSFVE